MKIVKHAKYDLHVNPRGTKTARKNYAREIREGYTVCGAWLSGNFESRRDWFGRSRKKEIHVAKCVRTVTCKLCLRNAGVQVAISDTKGSHTLK